MYIAIQMEIIILYDRISESSCYADEDLMDEKTGAPIFSYET